MAQVDNNAVSRNSNPEIFAKLMANPFPEDGVDQIAVIPASDSEFIVDANQPSVFADVEVAKERRGLDLGLSLLAGASGDDPAVGGSVQVVLPRFELASFGSHGSLGVKPGVGFSALNIFRSREYSPWTYEDGSYESIGYGCEDGFGFACSEVDSGSIASDDLGNITIESYDTSLRINLMIHMYIALGRLGPGLLEFSYGPEISGEFYQVGVESEWVHNMPFALSGGFTYAMDNGWAVNLGVKSDIIDLTDIEGIREFNDRRMILGNVGASYMF